MPRLTCCSLLLVVSSAVATTASAQQLALSPARMALTIAPGGAQTVAISVQNIVPKGKKGATARLLATLKDWDLGLDGKIVLTSKGTHPSATPWVTYSPTEFLVPPNRATRVRITVTVPRGTKPGDYITALMIRPRPPSIRKQRGKRQMMISIQLMAVIYVSVPPLNPRPVLEGLSARVSKDKKQVEVTVTLRNAGNHLFRPTHEFVLLDSKGKRVGQAGGTSSPVLRQHRIKFAVKLKRPPKGAYQVRYRAKLTKLRKVLEGRTRLSVP